MATSGVVTLEFNIAEIVEEAFERAGVDVQDLNVGHAKTARRSLNYTFMSWINRNVRVFSIENKTHPLASLGETNFTLPAGTLDVLDVVLTRSSVDTPMVTISRSDYHTITDKSTRGRPDRYWIHRPTSGPVMFFWQAAQNTTDIIDYWRIRRLFDITAAAETPDVPYRWHDALVSELAFRLFMKKPLKERTRKDRIMLAQDMDKSFYLAFTEDRERAPTQILPIGYGNRIRM